MAALQELAHYLDELLEVRRYEDYCPNGLQVEGRPQVRRMVGGVTACRALIEAAVAAHADAILVHHGYFWKGEDPRVVGLKAARLRLLLAEGVSLFAYHLPLDFHPEFGNNIQLARRLGLSVTGGLAPDGGPDKGLYGTLDPPLAPTAFARRIEEVLQRAPLWIDGGGQTIRSIAWCTGAAQGFIGLAVERGADAYLSGEISEPTVHTAREAGIHYFAAGHHATERYGVQALGARLQAEFGIEFEFVDVPNPV